LAISSSRLPKRVEIAPVYAACVFPIFSWSIVWFFQKMPGWLPYLSLTKVLSILAYGQAFALFESALLLLLLILPATVLPARFFRDRFTAQASTIAFTLTFWAIVFQIINTTTEVWAPGRLSLWAVLLLASLVILCALVRRSGRLAQITTAVAERLTVFLYIYVPLGLLGLAVVVARNIL
jgi:hypothetical protein